MENQINHMPRKRKKKSKSAVFLRGIFDIIIFLVITTPLVLFFGPYDNIRKTVISTVLATRHAYLINDLISQTTLDKILGIDDAAGSKEVPQDMKKINVKYKVGDEIDRYDIHIQRFDGYVLEVKNTFKVKVAMTKYLGKVGGNKRNGSG